MSRHNIIIISLETLVAIYQAQNHAADLPANISQFVEGWSFITFLILITVTDVYINPIIDHYQSLHTIYQCTVTLIVTLIWLDHQLLIFTMG